MAAAGLLAVTAAASPAVADTPVSYPVNSYCGSPVLNVKNSGLNFHGCLESQLVGDKIYVRGAGFLSNAADSAKSVSGIRWTETNLIKQDFALQTTETASNECRSPIVTGGTISVSAHSKRYLCHTEWVLATADAYAWGGGARLVYADLSTSATPTGHLTVPNDPRWKN
ncbi:hypothetical protein [Streptomyces sp. NPDC053431]|uniref:hypothetical protein n=1 Tax=Streptomyces sp. NPDC053431 TaxID=3365703 RepID=UPI0037D5EA04